MCQRLHGAARIGQANIRTPTARHHRAALRFAQTSLKEGGVRARLVGNNAKSHEPEGRALA